MTAPLKYEDCTREQQKALDLIAEMISNSIPRDYLTGTAGQQVLDRLKCRECENDYPTDSSLLCCDTCWAAMTKTEHVKDTSG